MKPSEKYKKSITLETHGEAHTLDQANRELLQFADMDAEASPLSRALQPVISISEATAPVQPMSAEMQTELGAGLSTLAMQALLFARYNSHDELLRTATGNMINEFVEKGGDPSL